MTELLRIAIAEDDRGTRERLHEYTEKLGHRVVAAVEDGLRLVECCRETPPDLAVAAARLSGLDGIRAAAAINQGRLDPVPFVLVSRDPQDLALDGLQDTSVMAWLFTPLRTESLKTAFTVAWLRGRRLQGLLREVAELRQSLEDRKLLDRAKGIVMKRLGLDEEGSFRRLRKLASDSNRKVIEVARQVLLAEGFFHDLECLPRQAGPPGFAARSTTYRAARN